ncbi:MAG: carboxypeptidase regulatory-like domain-containing protein, partial [Massilia sp.]
MLKKTVLVHALTLAFGVAAVGVGVMSPAMAQSNATGTVYGTVTPGANVQVQIENPATGLRRTLTPDASGRFTASALPTGSYRVSQLRDGKVVSTVEVDAGIGSNVEALFPAANGIQTVQVTGA